MKHVIKNNIIICPISKKKFIELKKIKKLKGSKIKILILEFNLLVRLTYSMVHIHRTTKTKHGNKKSKYIEDKITGIPIKLIKDLLLLVLLLI